MTQRQVITDERPDHFDSGSDSSLSQFFTYFAHATISIPQEMVEVIYGPLPYRQEDSKVTWPTEPGTVFDGWYWKEELDRARAAGYHVEIHRGLGWYNSEILTEQDTLGPDISRQLYYLMRERCALYDQMIEECSIPSPITDFLRSIDINI